MNDSLTSYLVILGGVVLIMTTPCEQTESRALTLGLLARTAKVIFCQYSGHIRPENS